MDTTLFGSVRDALGDPDATFERISPAAGGGLSGTPIYRVESLSKRFALRAWPLSQEAASKIRLWKEVGSVCDEVWDRSLQPPPLPRLLAIWQSRDPSIRPHLDGDFLDFDDNRWTLSEWMPGAPIVTNECTKVQLDTIVCFIAHFHNCAKNVARGVLKSRGMSERFERVQWMASNRLTLSSRPPAYVLMGLSDDRAGLVHHRIDRFWEQFLTDAPRMQRILSIWKDRHWQQHWIVRDLWRENILMEPTTGRFSIVDLGASRSEAPFFDLVRFLGSMSLGLQEWSKCWQTYHSVAHMPLQISVEEGYFLHRVSTAIGIEFWTAQLSGSGLSDRNRSARLFELIGEWERAFTNS